MHRIKIALTALLLVGGCFSPAFSQSFGQFKQLADDAFNAGKYSEAEKIWTQAKASCEQNDDKGPRYQACMAGLAKALTAQNKTADAEPLYKNLMAAKDAGSASEEVDAAIADYISMLKKAGKDDAAKEIAAKYPVKAASAPAEAPKPSAAGGPQEEWRQATERGTQALTNKQYDAAEQSFKQALSVAENASLIKESADSLNRLVRLYSWQKKYSQAETMCAHLVDLVKLSAGARSQAYADMLLAHADLLRHLNRTSEAMKREGLAETIKGPNSPSSASGFTPGGSTDGGGSSANKDGYVTHGGEGTRNGGSIWNRARAAQQTGGGGTGSYNNLVNDLLKE